MDNDTNSVDTNKGNKSDSRKEIIPPEHDPLSSDKFVSPDAHLDVPANSKNKDLGQEENRHTSKGFLLNLLKTIKERFLHAFDEFLNFFFAILSVALLSYITKFLFKIVGIEENSFEFKIFEYIIHFAEAALILKFVFDRLRKPDE